MFSSCEEHDSVSTNSSTLSELLFSVTPSHLECALHRRMAIEALEDFDIELSDPAPSDPPAPPRSAETVSTSPWVFDTSKDTIVPSDEVDRLIRFHSSHGHWPPGGPPSSAKRAHSVAAWNVTSNYAPFGLHTSRHHAYAAAPPATVTVAQPQVNAALARPGFVARCFTEQGAQHVARRIVSDPAFLTAFLAELARAKPETTIELMGDKHGSQAIRRAVERATPAQRLELIRRSFTHLVRLATSEHGSGVVRRLVNLASLPAEAVTLRNALKSSIPRLVADRRGARIVAALLEHFSEKDREFACQSFVRHCGTTCASRGGAELFERCCIVADRKSRRALAAAAMDAALALASDEFGARALMAALAYKDTEASPQRAFVNAVSGQEAVLCFQKHSACVIEQCLACASRRVRARLVERILSSGALHELVMDEFSARVIVKILKTGTNKERRRISDAVSTVVSCGRTPEPRVLSECTQMSQ